MAFKAFTLEQVFEKLAASKERDKSSIQCVECYDRNVYIGTKDATVQHLFLTLGTHGDQSKTREGRARKLGSSSSVTQLRAVPLFNHLLVLWDRCVTALNMFSLEPVPALKKIQHVSLFELCESSLAAQAACVEMVTSSSRRKVIRIHAVGVDRWEVVKEVPLLQDPVALAVDGTSLCIATSDRYLLCDIQTGSTEELFPHQHSRQHAIVTSVGRGEFLLNGPGFLGMFVMKTGICQRPPLQWPQEVLAAGVCFPYILTLQPQMLSVYSMLDQQHKQTVSLSGAKGLISTSGKPGNIDSSTHAGRSYTSSLTNCVFCVLFKKTSPCLFQFVLIQSIILAPTNTLQTKNKSLLQDGALVFTERDVFCLSLVPFEEQIQALVGHEKVEEALLLLDGVQSHRPLESYKELQKAITCLAGFAHFYREDFSEARDLFIKGELDPREIIRLYPGMQLCLGEDFQSHLDQVNKGRDLQVLWQDDRNTFHHYLAFLGDFLRAVRGTEQGLKCSKEVDGALLRLYVELGDTENLLQLVDSPNECSLDQCVPVLEQHNRFFALGFLYESHGLQNDALKTWVKITDGFHKDSSCSDVYGHIVRTLSQLEDKDTVWAFADWTLQRNQEIGVQIFTKRPPDDQFETQNILTFLEKYPLALLSYLEFLIHDLNSEEERYHNRLAVAYVNQTLQEEEETKSDARETRGKLQQMLWDSEFYDISTVYDRVKSTTLHPEKAILLGRAGEHSTALQLLVHEEKDLQAAEVFCCRAAQGRGTHFRQVLLLNLLQIYLSSEALTGAAVDLLNSHPQLFALEKVIQLLPESWSVQLVSPFIVGSLRKTFHQRQMARVQKALAQAELLRHKVMWMQASQTKFRVGKEQKCSVCQRNLVGPQFVRNLQGELMHTSCTGYSAS
ncbi:transforming growth factor-beta receptor-associated protein 1 isoform X1 [Acanthochromis polyacanthus]|uniref:transforming growth factor-beta receptor-associated protein 1 isoform X1 n=1 Tax=Acanthochromis polyacanthus TaxID=80966 RepID=UPI00223496CD|nr:transforming growth factor-beta receptor-associated protein 1 isoform X1 [Acanthochromis polyacanthus]